MRVIHPLFNFQYFDKKDFEFSDGRLAIRHYDNWSTLHDREIFSQRDRAYIDRENKALVAEGTTLAGFEGDLTLLLIACRVLAVENRITPIVKYRLSEDEDKCARLEETEMHIRSRGYLYQTYSVSDFPEIDRTFMALRAAELASQRLGNAFFFLYRAFNSYHWIDAFLFYMSAVESLFSLDQKGPAKKPICCRAARILNDPHWTYETIEGLYDTRSRIAHGRLEAGRDSAENLALTAKMEVLVKLCVRRLIEMDALKHYGDQDARNAFLAQFD